MPVADVSPARALDPNVMLATSLQAQPGVHALLLGSGVSTGAGIPTGWGVVRDLVRRAAAAKSPDDAGAPQRAFDNPDEWWAENGDGHALGYSNLLGSLGATPAARRSLLAGFFEPSEEDTDAGLKVPSPAHRAIADLVKRGYIRVILTTNFDRLTERALEDAGVSPQVISNANAIAGMAPLQHASATVIKLHGDYADLLQRNTIDELEAYPEELNGLLDRVLAEYGLLVSGWSADWDTALVAAIERIAPRRYPLFWDSRSAKGDKAKRLLALRNGAVVPSADADELFTGLLSRVDAVERLAEAPITTAMSIQRLKRYLPDERRRIDLHDLVISRCDEVAQAIQDDQAFPQMLRVSNEEFYVEGGKILDHSEAVVDPLARLVMVGIQHDDPPRFSGLWTDCLQRLLRASRRVADGQFQQALTSLRLLPALLYLRAAGLTAVLFENDALLIDFMRTRWFDQYRGYEVTAARALADYRVLDGNLINAQPRWDSRWEFPQSHYLRAALRPLFADLLPQDRDYEQAQDDLEYRIALIQYATQSGSFRAMPGEFILDSRWSPDTDVPLAQIRFEERVGDGTARGWSFLGGQEEGEGTLESLAATLRQMRHGL